MLKCRSCRVARFCSTDHQKMASKKGTLGSYGGNHRDETVFSNETKHHKAMSA